MNLEMKSESPTSHPALKLENVSFSITKKTIGEKVRFKEGKRKFILENISCSFEAGEIVAFMGASGCGKTTLMDILACRKSYGNVDGNITYNGIKKKKLSNSEAGYVPQSDVALAQLTVKETLEYATRLRVPNLDEDEIDDIVEKLMEDLLISHCAKTKVGNTLIRGISGGELRRLSIAQDLVYNPSLLFLDEPTSGLDSYASYEIVSILKKLARTKNQLIIMTIHQPSSQIFHLFDKLLLLTKSYSPRIKDIVGRVGYFGPVKNVASYFETHLGRLCPPDVNIADFVINETAGRKRLKIFEEDENEKEVVVEKEIDKDVLVDKEIDKSRKSKTFISSVTGSKSRKSGDQKEPEITNFGDKYEEYVRSQSSNSSQNGEEKLGSENSDSLQDEDKKEYHNYPTSWLNQFWTLTERSYLDAFRSPDFIFNRVLKPHIIGFIISSIYFRMDFSPYQIQNRVSCVFFTLLSSFMLSQALLPIFIVTRPIASREKGSRLYGALAQMLSQLAVILPLEIVNGFIYITYIIWVTNLMNDSVDTYFLFSLMYLSNLTLMMLYALMVGSIAPTGELAAVIAPIFFLLSLVVSGFFILINAMPVWWKWARWLSPLYYALSASLFIEFNGIEFNCTLYNCTFQSGNDVLAFYNILFDYPIYWAYQSAVWGFILLCFLALYLSLRFMNWEKR